MNTYFGLRVVGLGTYTSPGTAMTGPQTGIDRGVYRICDGGMEGWWVTWRVTLMAYCLLPSSHVLSLVFIF